MRVFPFYKTEPNNPNIKRAIKMSLLLLHFRYFIEHSCQLNGAQQKGSAITWISEFGLKLEILYAL